MPTHDQQTKIADLLEEAVRSNQPDASFRWRRMFGGAGYYVNDVIFAANYGDDRLALKLPEEIREALIDQGETQPNSVQYITIPEADVQDDEKLAEWVGKSMDHVGSN